MNAVLTGLLARAGGGHGFDGGGGGSGDGASSGHTGIGGGGFFFFSGGGSSMIVLLVMFVVLVGFVGMFRFRRRPGPVVTDSVGAPPSPMSGEWSHSDRPAIESVRGDLFPGTAVPESTAGSSEDGMAAITARDPRFNKEEFLGQVQRSFFVVEEAWSRRKPELSRQVMADGLWQQHRVQISGYVDAHKRNVLEDLAVGTITVIVAGTDANYDTITVRILASCADYDVDDRTDKLIRGNKEVGQWSEDWTFQRSSSAKTPQSGGTLSDRCPNCGAPLDLDLVGECKYCKAPVSSGNYDWVLARISQVPPSY
jgi:predicted lipid-binding transport protein (Tim44 family)